jgi:hypothetical protein
LQNRTKHHAKFLAKMYPFSIWARGKKNPKNPHPSHEKFGILDGTKHTYENFGILHFIIVAGILHFAFHGELNTAIV